VPEAGETKGPEHEQGLAPFRVANEQGAHNGGVEKERGVTPTPQGLLRLQEREQAKGVNRDGRVQVWSRRTAGRADAKGVLIDARMGPCPGWPRGRTPRRSRSRAGFRLAWASERSR
jgi:hypothetical protein